MTILGLLLALTCVAPPTPEMVGLWELAPGSSGLGHALELRANGTYADVMTVMVDSEYRVSNGRLTTFGDKSAAQSADGEPFTVSRRRLVQTRGKLGKIAMARVGSVADPANLVVGVWRYRHYTGGTAFERYLPDGRILFRLPLPGSRSGCFIADAATVSLASPEGPTVLRRTSPSVLQQEQDGDTPFLRVNEGPWYPLK